MTSTSVNGSIRCWVCWVVSCGFVFCRCSFSLLVLILKIDAQNYQTVLLTDLVGVVFHLLVNLLKLHSLMGLSFCHFLRLIY